MGKVNLSRFRHEILRRDRAGVSVGDIAQALGLSVHQVEMALLAWRPDSEDSGDEGTADGGAGDRLASAGERRDVLDDGGRDASAASGGAGVPVAGGGGDPDGDLAERGADLVTSRWASFTDRERVVLRQALTELGQDDDPEAAPWVDAADELLDELVMTPEMQAEADRLNGG